MSDLGAVANVSGAVGLFRPADLRRQSARTRVTSRVRTCSARSWPTCESEGAGVAYSPNRVETLAPPTWRALFGQRSRRGTADHELVFLNLRLMLDPNIHPVLRFERGYAVLVLLADPVRMLFFVSLFLSPRTSCSSTSSTFRSSWPVAPARPERSDPRRPVRAALQPVQAGRLGSERTSSGSKRSGSTSSGTATTVWWRAGTSRSSPGGITAVIVAVWVLSVLGVLGALG